MVGIDPLVDSSSAPKALPEDTSDFGTEEGMPLSPDQQAAVQFTSSDNNGDAKVELGSSIHPPHFVGLGKEELMKYANDPFWVRLRWTLFILFWLLWISMLAGAIVIIVFAPKCAGPSNEGKTFYQIQIKNFADDGSIAKIESKVDYLKSLNIDGIILTQPLESEISGTGVDNFEKVNPNYGTNEILSSLIATMKKENINVMIEMFPNHVSVKNDWFKNQQSEDLFVKKGDKTSNWVTIKNNKTAWLNTDPYLHLMSEDDVDLNYDNSQVTDKIKKVLQYWKGIGVSGFLLNGVSYLYDDLEKLNEKSINHAKNLEILKQFQTGTTLLGVDDMSVEQTIEYYKAGLSPIIRDLTTKLKEGFSAKNLFDVVKPYDQISAPVWQLSTPYSSRLVQIFGAQQAYILSMVSFSLPGAVILLSGDELGIEGGNKFNWDSTLTSPLVNYTRDLTNLHRVTEKGEVKFYEDKLPSDVFAFLRTTTISKRLVVLNLSTNNQIINFPEFSETNWTIKAKTPKLPLSFKKGNEISLKEITLDGKSGIVVELN